ncbi:MAG: ATP-grasp domain-containing protein [Eubacteriales bacterium]|nr:ATP-grasp domain-containing protein [Eubacteriales bacterium]
MKKVMLVAGGKWQVPLAKKIKELGHHLLCSNLYPDSPAFAYAEQSFVADVLNVERNMQIAQEHHIDAIVSDQSDISMHTVASIAERLHLPSNGLAIADLFQDKIQMRQHCKTHGFYAPNFAACKTVEDAQAFMQGKSKIVIKPQNSQASRGVFFVHTTNELHEKFPISQSFAHGDKLVIAEEFMDGGTSDGREFTIDGIFINGKHHSLAISKKRHYAYNKSIASELFFSMHDEEYNYEAFIEQNNRLMESTGAQMGLTHNEYKWHNGQFYLIEMSNRGGGNGISSHIVPVLSGVDNLAHYVRQAMGEKVDVLQKTLPTHPYAIMKFFEHSQFSNQDAFVIQSISGIEAVLAHPNVLDVCINHSIGETMMRAQNGTNRPGYYIAFADSKEELAEIDQYINRTIQVQ